MLAIRRKSGQSVRVGPDVTVTVVEVRGSYALLAFDAPRDVKISRIDNPQEDGRDKPQPASA